MAFKVEDLPNSIPGNANYPNGSGQDETVPGSSGDGTQLVANVYNDIQGLLQALLSKESITASGSPDTALNSQYHDSLGRFLARGPAELAVAPGGTCGIGKVNRIDNSGGPVTVNLPTTGLYAFATVLFSAEPPVAYSSNPVTFDAQTETIGGTAQTVEMRSNGIIGGFRRNRDNTTWLPIQVTAVGS